VTARWVVGIASERDLDVVWRPISLFWKNNVTEESDHYDAVRRTHNLLRVMESVRETDGNDGVERLYTEYGRRIHHDQDRDFDLAEALAAVGLDPSHAAAYDDEAWDPGIRKQMDDGLALVGDDFGTPILAWQRTDGQRVAYFGPVITRVPPGERSLQLWDSLTGLTDIDGFWELKRARTERPDFGPRP
jgi:hypothetical protein